MRYKPSFILLGSLLLLGVTMVSPAAVRADDDPERIEIIEVVTTENEWWIVYWQNGTVGCELIVDHTNEPTPIEILNQCGKKIYDLWMASDPCINTENEDLKVCEGMYLQKVGSQLKNVVLEIDLPPISVRADLNSCTLVDETELCEEIPTLLITADEPLPNEDILTIQGTLNDIPFFCDGDFCDLPLRETSEEGFPFEFWAESSYGDSSQQYEGRIRVAESIDLITERSGWKVDIISADDNINTISGCAEIWSSFPPVGSPPKWLGNPQNIRYLETDEPYTYLAGQLIFRGYVDTSDCEYFGLLPNGYASQCGLEKSREAVKIWQNTFDTFFILSARDAGLPTQLLKRIYAKESQFWPETMENVYSEYGPGHINELGADTALFWNRDFYNQFCPLILAEDVCNMGYSQLDEWSKVLLRGAFLSEIAMDLPPLDLSIDPDQVMGNISLFAETILGNCSQVGQIVTNQVDRIPGEVVSHEDLWKFTLVNYHGGPGCLGAAVDSVDDLDQSLTWENISRELRLDCPWAVDYVNDIVY